MKSFYMIFECSLLFMYVFGYYVSENSTEEHCFVLNYYRHLWIETYRYSKSESNSVLITCQPNAVVVIDSITFSLPVTNNSVCLEKGAHCSRWSLCACCQQPQADDLCSMTVTDVSSIQQQCQHKTTCKVTVPQVSFENTSCAHYIQYKCKVYNANLCQSRWARISYTCISKYTTMSTHTTTTRRTTTTTTTTRRTSTTAAKPQTTTVNITSTFPSHVSNTDLVVQKNHKTEIVAAVLGVFAIGILLIVLITILFRRKTKDVEKSDKVTYHSYSESNETNPYDSIDTYEDVELSKTNGGLPKCTNGQLVQIPLLVSKGNTYLPMNKSRSGDMHHYVQPDAIKRIPNCDVEMDADRPYCLDRAEGHYSSPITPSIKVRHLDITNDLPVNNPTTLATDELNKDMESPVYSNLGSSTENVYSAVDKGGVYDSPTSPPVQVYQGAPYSREESPHAIEDPYSTPTSTRVRCQDIP